jgi:DNA-directed RNA polymerase subunit RPC12/RpoP
MNRSATRLDLANDAGPARCPACEVRLFFRSDRLGRTYAQCDCGYRAYVERRSPQHEEVAVNAAGI